MKENIHKILQDAGVAKGISKNEVEILVILGDRDLLDQFLHQIKTTISEDEFAKLKTVFEQEHRKIEEAQKKYEDGLRGAISQVKTEIFQEKISNPLNITPQELKILEQEIAAL